MHKILVIARRELLNLVGKPAFWIGMILVPVVIGAVVLVVGLTSVGAAAASAASRDAETKVQGVIDNAGLLRNQPAVLQSDPNLKLLATEAEARALLDAREINGFYVIATDYLASGKVRYVANEFSPIDASDRTDAFEKSLRLALFNDNRALAQRYEEPIDVVSTTDLSPKDAARSNSFFPVPVIAGVMFMASLLGASSYLMQTVATEKENRVMEVLLASISPKQLLTGKILGLGAVGFIQMALWMISTFSALPTLQKIPMIQPYLGVISPEAVVWSTVFFVFGYFIYAALMAGLGAIVPTLKDGTSYSIFIMLPLIAPMYLVGLITEKPDSALAVALSLFPFSTPVAMPMRMLSSSVPFWQPLLAAVLMLGTAWLTLTVVARIFSAQALLRGSKVPLGDVLRLVLRGAQGGARA